MKIYVLYKQDYSTEDLILAVFNDKEIAEIALNVFKKHVEFEVYLSTCELIDLGTAKPKEKSDET